MGAELDISAGPSLYYIVRSAKVLMPSDEAEAAKARGNAALAAKDYALAVECYTEAIRADGTCHTYFR